MPMGVGLEGLIELTDDANKVFRVGGRPEVGIDPTGRAGAQMFRPNGQPAISFQAMIGRDANMSFFNGDSNPTYPSGPGASGLWSYYSVQVATHAPLFCDHCQVGDVWLRAPHHPG